MRISFHPEKCTECRDCMEACRRSHQGVARLEIRREEGVPVLSLCRRCKKPACAYACTYEVMYREKEFRTIRIREEECQVCHACYRACPFGSVFLDPETGIPAICDLCDGSPQCVAACPADALEIVEEKENER